MSLNHLSVTHHSDRPEPDHLKHVFEANLELGVSFRDCFMLVLKQTGYTQAGLMRLIGRKQPELSQYLNGHRQPNVPIELRDSCEDLFGFDPWSDWDHVQR